ncbi:3-(3-hydroxy-phenyl)propionate/3-hydroxycinnamic acid hydroxylase [Mycobacterium marinum]|uniref:3-(3-hydroxy-phenyl)propionate/3-hydroxycinnamic acid hydroxylase n=1 Tax=Mycobacterium marinum TaxID=1781 RepID=A0A3E2MZ43_MYCMR|nr:FAD-dependent oxidoreductase [Mycobacterium marinum]AXN45383.1 3-(3-hydroxy-phenyl)propionate/3-hydroxycinnamic acid hydroxylase [Mycobacterium marinum]AXN50679.1 3-(3-hydroxy-phenyl)propionate/3-hydroxycinnamic acid hydroxylase [Mycobacterium marinum]RFZ07155.1 3-(3-hydroxy-phenyl)propionate/3-hydroxycinnamic acid hydroxylase [Mycobacterium marinum]RFZ10963.1 3-(3-hydroxy-phenyl)propionate/3-hydroxycinnamic acid hydroxylase [Mycobacterium marinum]RFZ16403.1 3-(3-hydroxy-phenyl)propionate/3
MESELRARCCVAGGGPAGMMLGYLLARAGVDVIVLEKHADFLRDFRGDTIHPSTLEVMNELGLYDQLLQRPHQPTPTLNAQFGSFRALVADFRHLPVRGKFVAMMPQWDFLDFIAKEAQRFSSFRLLMRAEVTKLIEEPNRVTGVVVNTPDGEQKIHSDLVIGCDGRTSTVRAQAGLQVLSLGAPMDVLWFRMSRRPGDPEESMGNFGRGAILVLINRGDYWQCGFVIAKGSIEQARRHGVEFFREEIVKMAPFVKDRVAEITDFDDLRLLTVSVDRLKQWHRPGLLCIGDAAHAMSPIGGVGINLAIQDAVAAANLLISPLRRGQVSDADLQRVQARRELPTRATQAVQVFLQKNVVTAVLGTSQQFKAPLPVRLIRRLPLLARIPARLIGMGVRPEHPDLAVIDKPGPT